MSTAAVLAEGVHVSFGDVHALAGVDLTMARGSTLGLLGHNGAGKTTLVRVLTTAITPDAGRVVIDGFDVVRDGDQVRRRIGVTGQFAGLDEFLTGRENIELVARLGAERGRARAQAGALIDRLSLGDIADRRVRDLSGGSRRRIDLAVSMVGAPSVLFLDEPTTGLDPSARLVLWELVEELNRAGTTILLTTQYLEEADRLADDIVVLDHGRVAARGTPADLKRLVGGKVVTATLETDDLIRLDRVPDDASTVGDSHSRITYSMLDADDAVSLITRLNAEGVALSDLQVSSPSLDDVFAQLTLEGSRP